MVLRPRVADRILKNLSSAKTGKPDYQVISQRGLKTFCIAEEN
jgi:hypothetical protein